jgi:Putative F0F1-ATPase subunit Ca2+/Mg2+ transporter
VQGRPGVFGAQVDAPTATTWIARDEMPHLIYPSAVISRENLQLIGHLSSVGFAFVFAIVIGFGGGYLIDQWLGTRPWLAFLGFFLGLAAGILNVYRIMQLAQKK